MVENIPGTPKRPCAHSGCAALVEYGQRRCTKHKKYHNKQVNKYRRDASLNLYTPTWRRYSAARLQEHPWCKSCSAPAEVTDHIVPHGGDEDLFWNEENHQSLCKRCHDHKTNTEDRSVREGRHGHIVRHSTEGIDGTYSMSTAIKSKEESS